MGGGVQGYFFVNKQVLYKCLRLEIEPQDKKNFSLVLILRLRRKKPWSRLVIETSGNKVSVSNQIIWSRYSLGELQPRI